MIDQELIKKSHDIFDKLDKWNALFELHALSPKITDHWLKIGTRALREHFRQHRSGGWCCEHWDNEIDTQWYLEGFGIGSLAIGFGWKYEFHLHLKDSNRFNSGRISEQLRTEKYGKLLMNFGVEPKLDGGHGSLAMEQNRNFTFENSNHGQISLPELAWYAAHETDNFIKQAAAKIERFTRDEEMTRLLTELNADAKM